MGFLKKIKKAVKSVVKVAKVTAPLWSSFIPGGSIASSILGGQKLGGVQRAAAPIYDVMSEVPPMPHPVKPRGVRASSLYRRSSAVRTRRRVVGRAYGASLNRRSRAVRLSRRARRAA